MSKKKILKEEQPQVESVVAEEQQLETEEATVEPEAEIVPEGQEKSEETTGISVQTESETDATPYYDNYYLLYGNKEKGYLDLDGASKLLQALGFDGGELRQARNSRETFQTYKGNSAENEACMYCSYCGLEITGIEYERLPDDRVRCTSCSNTLVKGEEMQELFDRVKANMEAFFGASITVPIFVEVLEERKLKKKIKCPISAVDDKSLLVLGAAVNDKNGYHLYIENGAPRISVIATFAHELTHIWQYVHWDNKHVLPPCLPAHRLLIYEGMAKWVEIQYLYLMGETAVARREEFITREREDEYGIGFKLYEKQYPLSYETIICNNSPFVKDRYPIEI